MSRYRSTFMTDCHSVNISVAPSGIGAARNHGLVLARTEVVAFLDFVDATKYHRLVRNFLTENGVADYQLVDSQGATEGTVKNLTAEAIADITSSGETLIANHLKILSDGLIHHSQARLYAARPADWSGGRKPLLADLCATLGLPPPAF